tara:strand:+ start:7932 stop:8366 length:435 start_codon:yes stop_codon:yes gene_type:complete
LKKIFVIIFILSINSCGLHLLDKKNEKKIILTYASGPCNGTCPVYKIIYFSDGTGLFNGIINTNIIDEYFKYSKREMRSIIKLSEKINFTLIQNEFFSEGLQDVSIKEISILDHTIRINEQSSIHEWKDLNLLLKKINELYIIE